MKEPNHTARSDSAAAPSEHGPKKPYQTPGFRFERVFEVSALSCGKVHNTQGSCHANRKAS